MLRYGGTTQNHRAHRVNSLGLGEDLYFNGLTLGANFNERHLPSRCPNVSSGETYPRRPAYDPSQRERHALDFYSNNSSLSMMDRFSYQPTRSDDLRNRQVYGDELRHQIQDNQRRRQLRDEQNRLDQLRYEQLVLRMRELESRKCGHQEEQLRRHSEDLLRRKQELQSRLGYHHRRHMDSESSVTSCLRTTTTTDVASKSSSHYSPPVSRRNPTSQYSFNVPSTSVFSEPASRYNTTRYATTDSQSRRDTLKRMDSLNSYDRPSSRRNTFNRFDSLSRIDSLTTRLDCMGLRESSSGSLLNEGQRRHSATNQDLRRSPRLQRRSSSGRFEDPLPVPLLKAHSPVARELKNSIPFNSNSRQFSETTIRRLEDRWMGSKSMFANLDSFRR